MKISRRSLFIAMMLPFTFLGSLHAAPRSSWDGTWSGAWGGSRPTSITIAGERVLSYEYEGASTPVTNSKVTRRRVTYGDSGTVVTLTRLTGTTAFATLHTSQGDATAKLTKQ